MVTESPLVYSESSFKGSTLVRPFLVTLLESTQKAQGRMKFALRMQICCRINLTFNPINFLYRPLPGCVLQSGPCLQMGQRRAASIPQPLDIVPQVSTKLFDARRLSLLLQ